MPSTAAAYNDDASVTSYRGGVSQGTPIDFAARFTELRALSARLDAWPSTAPRPSSPGAG